MIWLVLGVLLWSCVHFIPTLARSLRERLIGSVGEGPYKGGFAVVVVVSIVLMVIGWRAAQAQLVYTPPVWGASVTGVLMLVAFILFVAARIRTNLKRVIRHPQLTSIVVWGIAHLLSNGDARSLVLFGGLAIWAIIEMALVSRREGAWQRPQREPLSIEAKPLLIGIVVYAVLFFLHPYLFGVSPMGVGT